MKSQLTGIGVRAVAALIFGAIPLAHASDTPDAIDLVDEVMEHLGFDVSHKQALLEGEILFSGMPDLETLPQAVAVAGAMLLVQRPWTELIDAYLSEETLRAHSDVLAFGTIPDQGGDVGVLDALRFDDKEQSELRQLLRVRPGNKFNLGLADIDRFAAIERGDAALAEAARVYREVLWARAEAYRSAGLGGMPPYARKSGAEAFPADEMLAALDSARVLERNFPAMYGALRNFPQGVDQVSESQLLWIKKAGKRPLAALVHRLLQVGDETAVAAEREFFVGHTYNSMLTLVGIAPYGSDTLIFAANRTYSEKVEGGGLRKSIGRKIVAKKIAARFTRLRTLLEAGETP